LVDKFLHVHEAAPDTDNNAIILNFDESAFAAETVNTVVLPIETHQMNSHF
jgi:hypothetical protein